MTDKQPAVEPLQAMADHLEVADLKAENAKLQSQVVAMQKHIDDLKQVNGRLMDMLDHVVKREG